MNLSLNSPLRIEFDQRLPGLGGLFRIRLQFENDGSLLAVLGEKTIDQVIFGHRQGLYLLEFGGICRYLFRHQFIHIDTVNRASGKLQVSQ